MTITEYYQHYKTKSGKELIAYPIKISDGSAKKFSELYEDCIGQHILNRDNVIAWHKMLLEYVTLEDAVFWVRRYESSSEKEKKSHNNRWVNRRACKTEYPDGFSYVFVSNFDAHEIFNMVRLGVVPNVTEFLELMKNHQFPMHYDNGKSSEEADIALYPQIGNPRYGILTVNHWYLAHILGVNNPQDYDCTVDFEQICPKGELSDWSADDGYMVRRMDTNLSHDAKEKIKALFLRFVDPINYYVVPGKFYQNNHGYHFKNNQIGEYGPLNDYVAERFADLYGRNIINDFRKRVLAKPLPNKACDEAIDISYSPIPVTDIGAYTEEKQLEAIAYYLEHNTGLIEVEQNVLNKNSHGSIARKILISHGIDTSKGTTHKGILLSLNIDSAISNASGKFKDTLERIKAYQINK